MRPLTVYCSPDADDRFMMWALETGRIDPGPFTWTIRTAPTDQLNRLASEKAGDVVAISVAWWPEVARDYLLLPHGGSAGEGYGPVVVAPHVRMLASLAGKRVAIPGLTTTAWAVLRMCVDCEPVVTPITPYERVFEALRHGEVEAALVIHEGRLTYEREGFVALADLGVWWQQLTGGLPLPLGANAIARDLGDDIPLVSDRLRESIRYALAHKAEAVSALLAGGTALRTADEVSHYLDLYANQRTLDWGQDGRHAIGELYRRAAAVGVLRAATPEFAP